MDYTTRHTDKKTFHLKDGVVLTLDANQQIDNENHATITLTGKNKLPLGAQLITEIKKSDHYRVVTDNKLYNPEQFQFKIFSSKPIASIKLAETITHFNNLTAPSTMTSESVATPGASFKLIP